MWVPEERQIWLPSDDLLCIYQNMNAKQAKELDLVEFIARMGHSPSKIRGNDIWYRSPIRPDEHTPSFKIDARKNIWYDFGLGQGGTIIDLVQHLYKMQDVARALSVISDISGGGYMAPPVPARTERIVEAPVEKPVIERVESISDASLEAYLTSRAIPLDLARLYLEQVSYRIGERHYMALAFRNNSQGYEIRNPYFKGTLGSKDVSFLRAPNRTDASIFEGVFDFLSVLAYYGRDRPRSSVLILNSVGMLERGIGELREAGTTRLATYLDNDPAGREALVRLEAESWEVANESGLYVGYKDFNEFLKHQ